jgi:iron complex outermembrane receptor protein
LDRDNNPIQAVFSPIKDYFCTSPVPSLGEVGGGIMSANTSFNSPFYTANPNFSEIPSLAASGFTLRNVFVDNIQGDKFIAGAPTLDHFGLIRRDYRASFQGDHEFDNGMSLVGNAAYSYAEGNKLYDWDNNGAEAGYIMAPTEYEDYFFEARLLSDQESRFRWLVGVNYYDGTVGFDFIGTTQLRIKFSDAVSRATRYTSSDSFGIFASAEYDITDDLGVIVEGRYQTDKETIVPTGQATQTFKEWIPRVIFTYDPFDDTHLYASYSVGVLPGRNNTAYITATQFVRDQLVQIYGPLAEVAPSDKLNNWEAGIKQRAFDGRVQYSLSTYYALWKNKKVTSGGIPVQTDPNDPNSFNFIGNVILPGEIKLWGGEFEGDAQITDEWQIGGTVAYNRTKNVLIINEGEGFFGTANFKGNQEPRNPRWSWTARTTYSAPYKGDWSWYTRGEALFKGKYFLDNANIGQMQSAMTVDWRLGLENDDWMVEAFVTNLFNNKDWIEGQRLTDLAIAFNEAQFPTNQGVLLQAPDKRQIGVRTRLNF